MTVGILSSLLALSYSASGLRFSRLADAVPKRYAYVTMIFDEHQLSDEDHLAMQGPLSSPGVTSPFHPKHTPYNDITLDYPKGGTSMKLQRESMEATDSESWAMESEAEGPATAKRAGQHFGAAQHMAAELASKGAKHPLLVLTNVPEQLALGVNASYPNLIPVSIENFLRGRKCIASHGYEAALQKVLLWNLTDYDKILWLDTDVTIEKNPDSIFDDFDTKGGVMAMESDMWCDHTPNFNQPERVKNRQVNGQTAPEHHELMFRNTTNHDLASSVMLLEPNKRDFESMIDLSMELQFCGTDQDLVAEHFWRKSKTQDHELMQFLPTHVAQYGRCSLPKFQKEPVVPILNHKKHATGWFLR